MNSLPQFTYEDYSRLLGAFVSAGFEFRPIVQMGAPVGDARVFYLRHDIDFHLAKADRIAEIDAEHGASSTFFVQVSGFYNPLLPANRRVIERMTELGHEVGLHYDLRAYPEDIGDAREHLRREVELLEQLSGAPVKSIVMHEPSAKHEDYFKTGSGYVHPHDPQYSEALHYISDSCRAWRDERILEALAAPSPYRLLVNLHPELWVDGTIEDRLEYLQSVSLPLATEAEREYFLEYLQEIWTTHDAVLLDEARRRDCSPEE